MQATQDQINAILAQPGGYERLYGAKPSCNDNNGCNPPPVARGPVPSSAREVDPTTNELARSRGVIPSQIPLQYDPTAADLQAAQRANPGSVDMSSRLVRLNANTVVPQDVFFALYTPWDSARYQKAKQYFEGRGHMIGGGTTAAPGTTFTVSVDIAGNAVPNYGRNARAENPNLYANTKSFSPISGSPPGGFPGQDLSIARAEMPFVPDNMIVLKGMGERGLPSYAIPTATLATNNPWDPKVINMVATKRAEELTRASLQGRAGFDAALGLTQLEAARSVQKYEVAKNAAVARGDVRGAFEAQNMEQKALRNLEEWSSAYHHTAKSMGIPVAANPYEAVGDLATEYLKGTPTKDSERFSPISGMLLGVLPTYRKGGADYGLGLQQDAWNQAVRRDTNKEVKFSDFSAAATGIKAAVESGFQGPYANLYGGKNFAGTVVSKPLGESVRGPQVHIMNIIERPSTQISGMLAGDRTVGGQTVAATVVRTAPAANAGFTILGVGKSPGAAIGNKKPAAASELLPEPFVSFNPRGIETVQPTGEIYGRTIPVVSDIYKFFQPVTYINRSSSVIELPKVTTLAGTTYKEIPGGVMQTTMYNVTGGTQTARSEVRTTGKSAYDIFNQNIRDGLRLPEPGVGERAMKNAQRYDVTTSPYIWGPELAMIGAEAIFGNDNAALKEIKKLGIENTIYAMAPGSLAGQYTQFYDQPALTGISFGAGVAFGTIFGGMSKIYTGSRTIAEPLIKSSRVVGAIDTGASFVQRNAPTVLGALYGADVAYRSTGGLTEFNPAKVIPAAKGIGLQEAAPMMIGFGVPGAIGQKVNVGRLVEVMAGEPGVTKAVQTSDLPFTGKTFFENLKSSIPTLTQIKGRYVEMKTQGTAMGSPMASERHVRPAIRTPDTPGYYRTSVSRGGMKEYDQNIARLEFYKGRLQSRPSGSRSPQDPYWKVMGGQPAEAGGISVTGLGGDKITGWSVEQSPFTAVRESAMGKIHKVSEIVAKYNMQREKVLPDIYGKTVTSAGTGGNAAVAMKTGIESVELPVVKTMDIARSYSPSQMYRYAGLRNRMYESALEYETTRLPPGMERPSRSDLVLKASLLGASGIVGSATGTSTVLSQSAIGSVNNMAGISLAGVSVSEASRMLKESRIGSAQEKESKKKQDTVLGSVLGFDTKSGLRSASALALVQSNVLVQAQDVYSSSVLDTSKITTTFNKSKIVTETSLPKFDITKITDGRGFAFGLPSLGGGGGGGGGRAQRLASFRELIGVLTPNEFAGINRKTGKPVYRVTGKKGLVEKRTPVTRIADPFDRYQTVPVARRSNNAAVDASGMEFYRAKTKQEGGPGIASRRAASTDIVELVGGFKHGSRKKSGKKNNMRWLF